MKLTYLVPTFDQVCHSTLWIFEDNVIVSEWLDDVFAVYPRLDREQIFSMPWEERKKYLKKEFKRIYQLSLPVLQKTAKEWNSHFQSQLPELTATFGKTFELDTTKVLNDMTGYPNLNPIAPRYLDEHSFYLFYRDPQEFVLTTSIHEMIHFFWFHKWQEHFHDKPEEYSSPHLKWIYSEMVEDTFARHSDFKKFFPAQYRNAYSCFYQLKINGQDALSLLADIYEKSGLTGLFTEGFDIMRKNEKQIRADLNQITNSSCYDPPAPKKLLCITGADQQKKRTI